MIFPKLSRTSGNKSGGKIDPKKMPRDPKRDRDPRNRNEKKPH
jgi:hypothetical protein